nr:carbon-nitrogen hydrolase family protein [uncultured Blautia sp.]
MKRTLNVSIIQSPMNPDTTESLQYLKEQVERLMSGYVKPELIIGVEHGLGRDLHRIPGKTIEFLGEIARKYGIYFIPGTMSEMAGEEEKDGFYNTCPVFGPDGSLLRAYRKKVPFRPGEPSLPSEDDEYCIFEIPEKHIKVGILICYDQFFPEIARTLALEGAELLVCPALDPMEYDYICDILPRARALENELFYIWTCGTGNTPSGTCCGHSTIVNPEGGVVYKCGSLPMVYTAVLDFDEVIRKRIYGRDQHLNSLREFKVKYPYSGRLEEAPVYENMPGLTKNPQEYLERISED